jgi:Protein kinase domain
MLDARTCSNCGSPLPARAPEGLCPHCLLRAGLGSEALSVGRSGEVSATLGLEGGVLETIAAALGTVPRVLLRDTDAGFEPPLVRPGRGDGADASTRYRIDGEIARGGMGSVLKGRDPDLGRDVAIKVLREDLRGNADMVRRFIEEAQIGGQLQHPGIVPIYELGTFADCRPFFSMKLVKGQTLAALLEARTGPATELPRFLDVVEAVAQTVAYAHARGVIHRDLKPSNVMVGSFGEVQVMDWGLAKVLPRGGVADDAAAGKTDRQETVIATARSGADDSDLSHAGSAMGTPSYMAPEQARGEIERVDERADVFALGSILCEVLTGKPAFVGRSSGEIQRKAALGDLGEAFGRLDGAGADGVLVGLAKEWLATEPEDRPRDAGVVAGRLRAYQASIQERMRQAELAQAAASARAEEAKQTAAAAEARANAERRARWLTVSLAAAVLALAALGGGGYSWMQQQRAGRLAATTRAVNEALDQAVRHQGEAHAAGDDLAKWAVALAQVDRAGDLLKSSESDPLLRDRVAAVRVEIEHRRAGVEEHARRVLADQKLLETLEAIRGGFGGPDDTKRTVASYRSAFLAAGLDLVASEPKQAGQWIAARTAPVELATHLDHWAIVHRFANDPESTWQRLIAAARAADPDPWRDALRAKYFSRDAADVEAFRRLGDDTKALDTQPTTSLVLLAQQFKYGFGDSARSEQVLRHAWHRDAGDFWVNFNLALVRGTGASDPAEVYPDTVEAIRFLSAAVAARPRSSIAHNELGRVLGARGGWTKRSPSIAQRSGCSPTMSGPTCASAKP